MSRDLHELFFDIRGQLSRKCGAQGIRTLARAFIVNDHTCTGIFDFHTFQSILGKSGVFLTRQELAKIYRSYDVERQERVDYREFLRDLVGEVGSRRKALIEKTFSDLDQTNAEQLDVEFLVQRFNPAGHPKVLDGTFTEKQVFTEFFDSFSGAVPGRSGKISKQEFIDYYADLSSAIPLNDEAFAKYLTGVWSVQEDPNASPQAAVEQRRVVRSIHNLISSKIQQRSKTGGAETDTLRKCFKTYDLDDEGRLSSGPFFDALSTFGITFDKKTQKLYFDSLPKCSDNKVDYTAFSHSIFGVDEGLLPAPPSSLTNAKVVTVSAIPSATKKFDTSAAQQTKTFSSTASTTATSVTQSNISKSAAAAQGSNYPRSESKYNTGSQEGYDEQDLQLVLPQDGEDESFPAVLFLLGGPCSGKTEQSSRLVNNLGFAHINVRILVASHLGDESSKYNSIITHCIAAGQVIPVDVVVAVIREEMEKRFQSGHMNFVIDGFPRSKRHLVAWNQHMGKYCRPPVFVLLDTPPEILTKRAQVQGLAQEEFEEQLGLFQTEQLPLCEWLAVNNALHVVSGESAPASVHSRILHIIENA